MVSTERLIGLGVVGGTGAATVVTAFVGAPIALCAGFGSVFFAGVTALVVSDDSKPASNEEKEVKETAQKVSGLILQTAEIKRQTTKHKLQNTIRTGVRAEEWWKIKKSGFVGLLFCVVSSANYLTIGKDCFSGNQNDYCSVSLPFFSLSTGLCAVALIDVAAKSVGGGFEASWRKVVDSVAELLPPIVAPVIGTKIKEKLGG